MSMLEIAEIGRHDGQIIEEGVTESLITAANMSDHSGPNWSGVALAND